MRKPNLLILEDDPVQRKLYKIICDRLSFTCTIFGESSELIYALQKSTQPYDVCITDWSLKTESGLDGINKIRQANEEAQRCSLPIVVITAHAMRGDRESCLR